MAPWHQFKIPDQNWPLSSTSWRQNEDNSRSVTPIPHPLPVVPNEDPFNLSSSAGDLVQRAELIHSPPRRMSHTPELAIRRSEARHGSVASYAQSLAAGSETGPPHNVPSRRPSAHDLVSQSPRRSSSRHASIQDSTPSYLQPGSSRRPSTVNTLTSSSQNGSNRRPSDHEARLLPPHIGSSRDPNTQVAATSWSLLNWNRRKSSSTSRSSSEAGNSDSDSLESGLPRSQNHSEQQERLADLHPLNPILEAEDASPPVQQPSNSERTSRSASSSRPSVSFDLSPRPSVSSSQDILKHDPPQRGSLGPPISALSHHTRHGSRLNPFEQAFKRGRQLSEAGPLEQNPYRGPSAEALSADVLASQSNHTAEVDLNAEDITRPSKAHYRSKSEGLDLFRRSPRKSQDVQARPGNKRRVSAPLPGRPSTFKRMMSIDPHPIPPRYRSKSVSSVGFYLSSLEKNNNTLPIFEDDIEGQKENVEEYLAAVEILQNSKKRKPWETHLFQIVYFVLLLCLVYFVFVGQPLWDGVALLYYRWTKTAGLGSFGVVIFMSWAGLQAFLPLLCSRFETEIDPVENRDASETALVIPAYKAAAILPETIKAALKIFKPEQIFIINNGNTEAPADNTVDVCKEYGVQHAYVPIGSKITAEFVGIALTRNYKYILLIDDDVHLPENFPLVTERLKGNTKCIGYTIKSTGANGSVGTIIQQCQNVEYTLAGLGKVFASKYGSSTFPHGAIILWEHSVLQTLFNVHPGYTISEDWFFGHGCRSMGYRIDFCSQVFVETETPPDFLWSSTAARGGFGEMTVYKQRFSRWNYFLAMRIWEDTIYILFSWRLGWREIVTKFFVVVEVYDSVLSFLRPFVVILTLIGAWRLFFTLFAVTLAMYIVAFVIFNAYHLRRKNEMVSWKVLPVYMWMKFVLLYVNSLSVYYGLYSYAKFFSIRHPRVIESRKALEAAYNVRLGTGLVPLDTHIGEVAVDPQEGQDDIQPILGHPERTNDGIHEKSTVNWI